MRLSKCCRAQYSSTYLLLAAVQGTAHSRNTRSTIGYSSHMIQNSPLVPPQHIYTQQRARVVRHTHDAGAAARRALVVTRRAGAAAPAIVEDFCILQLKTELWFWIDANGRPFVQTVISNYSGGGFCTSTEFWLCFQYVAVCCWTSSCRVASFFSATIWFKTPRP